MKVKQPFREPAKVVMHLDGGYTRVNLLRVGSFWDIPTSVIPLPLRSLGSEFLVIAPRFTPENHDTAEDIRRVRDQIEVCVLTTHTEFTEDC